MLNGIDKQNLGTYNILHIENMHARRKLHRYDVVIGPRQNEAPSSQVARTLQLHHITIPSSVAFVIHIALRVAMCFTLQHYISILQAL